jgi:diadenosine tetraphosphate (Ap4A) HIT family hydrolase
MEEPYLSTKYWDVFLSYDQHYLGRSIIVLKRDCGSLSDVDGKEWKDLHKLIKKMESALKNAFGATMFNWACLMNDAYKSENPKPQVHFHLRPRYGEKVEIFGEVFEDTEFAHHYDRQSNKKVSEEVENEIVKRIKKVFLKKD